MEEFDSNEKFFKLEESQFFIISNLFFQLSVSITPITPICEWSSESSNRYSWTATILLIDESPPILIYEYIFLNNQQLHSLDLKLCSIKPCN